MRGLDDQTPDLDTNSRECACGIKAELRSLQAELAAEKDFRRQTDATVKRLENQLHVLMTCMGKELQDTSASEPLGRTMFEDPCHATMEPVEQRPSRELHRILDPDETGQRIAEIRANGAYASLADMERVSERVTFSHKDLTEDMWGVAMMLLTRERFEMYYDGASCGKVVRFVYSWACVCLNLFLQLLIVFYVNRYIVGNSVWLFQGQYAQFRRELFTQSGEFKNDAWISWDGPRDEICDAVMNKRLFLSVILFLWFGRMLGELKLTLRMMKEVNALPGSAIGASIEHCVHVRAADDESLTEIIAMSTSTRAMVYGLIIIPKLLIGSLLAILGGQWLTATLSFSDLILNALALEFIVDIDENILSFFLPVRIYNRLGSTKFAYPDDLNATAEDAERDLIADYMRNLKYFLMCVGSTLVWVFYLQQVLPYSGGDIAEHCGNWYMHQYVPKCEPFEKGCFPYGNVNPPHDYAERLPS